MIWQNEMVLLVNKMLAFTKIISNKIVIVVACRSDRLLVMIRSMLTALSAQLVFTYGVSNSLYDILATSPFSWLKNIHSNHFLLCMYFNVSSNLKWYFILAASFLILTPSFEWKCLENWNQFNCCQHISTKRIWLNDWIKH